MKNLYQMRNAFSLREYNTAITRADFEAHFTKTRESVRFTFNGWDGKSYDGESRNAKVYRTDLEGYEDAGSLRSASTCTTSTRTAAFWRRPPANITRKPNGWWTSSRLRTEEG